MLNPAAKFRDFLQVLKNENDLVEITEEVDPEYEAGAVMRKVYENKLPVPLITNPKQNPDNIDKENLFRLVGCVGGLRDPKKGNDHARLALHLGLDSNTHMSKIIDYLVECKSKDPIPPKLVPKEEAAFKKNNLSGDQIDMTTWPAPLLHPEDGGKYLQTYGMFILQTPDKSWTNWSIARAMIHDKNHLTGLVIKPQHIQQVTNKWKEAGHGDNIPFVLAFGVPPASILISSMPIPDGATEADYIGALIGEPLKVTKAETVDLEVPIDSEIVLEGYLNVNNLVPEGPFGEMHGYCFPGTAHPCPTYTINHVSYRDNAIMPVSNPGLCTDETHTLIGGLVSAECKSLLKAHPVLGKIVEDVFTPYEAQALWLAVKINVDELAKLNTTSEELRKLVGDFLFPLKPASIIHEVVLFADDVDIFDFRQVIWAYVTRHTPIDDQTPFEQYPAFPLAPFISQGPRMKTKLGGKVVTDCLFPQQYKNNDLKFVACHYGSYDEKVKSKVDKLMESYGSSA